MSKLVTFSIVKNTPNEVRRDTSTEYYLLVYKVSYDDMDDYHYDSVLQIVSSIMEVLEYNDLSSMDGAVIRAMKKDGSYKDLYEILNDTGNKSLCFHRL